MTWHQNIADKYLGVLGRRGLHPPIVCGPALAADFSPISYPTAPWIGRQMRASCLIRGSNGGGHLRWTPGSDQQFPATTSHQSEPERRCPFDADSNSSAPASRDPGIPEHR